MSFPYFYKIIPAFLHSELNILKGYEEKRYLKDTHKSY